MSVLNENQLLGASGAGGDYEIEQSLRFNDDDNAYLSRTPSSAGNRRTFTYSVWIKRGNLGTQQRFFSAASASNNEFHINFYQDKIHMWNYVGSTPYPEFKTTQLFRDPSSWYHIVASVDSTNSTANDRMRLYVNGVRITAFDTSNNPDLNYQFLVNENSIQHTIGTRPVAYTQPMDGYMGEVNFIDGQALTPDSFGETGDYGEWKPIAYAGTYGTNGFYLPFEQDYTVEGFSTVVYEGKGVGQYIGGTGFSPSLTWIKARNQTYDHHLFDVIRGPLNRISSNSTSAESSMTNSLAAFNTDGFTLGDTAQVNLNNGEFVAWNWDMGGTTASNTNGSITSSVRANTTYGQSIVSDEGNGNVHSIGHGLASAPDMIIRKSRDGVRNWAVWHKDLTANYALEGLNTTGAEISGGSPSKYFRDVNSTTFSVGDDVSVNASGESYIAYCFHDVANYSKFGSYSGNGSTTGPVVTLGFSPAFVMIKRSDAVEQWRIFDNTRNPTNPVTRTLNANESNAESDNANNTLNFTSTGFQLTATNGGTNASGGTYIYAAFADTREYAYWYDQSGNNNDWTSEGGLTESDVMVDSPTNNFATLNPLDIQSQITLSEGNLKVRTNATGGGYKVRGTQQLTGKVYFEGMVGAVAGNIGSWFGIADNGGNITAFNSNRRNGFYYNASDMRKMVDGAVTVIGSGAATAGDVIGLSFDLDNNVFTIKKNNVALLTNQAFTDDVNFSTIVDIYRADSTDTGFILNFGADSSFAGNKTPQGNQDSNGIGDFFYAPPTGFLALCTSNLPSVDVIPSDNFNPVLWTGNGADGRDITNIGFTPDFVWIKSRSLGSSHLLNDTVRGANKSLFSEGTTAETPNNGGGYLDAFVTDGFSVTSGGSGDAAVNDNGATYVAWNWKAGGSAVSNTDGSITSSVSANPSAGFSIATYTGNTSSNITVGHGLNSAPELIFVKARGVTQNWVTYHSALGVDKTLYLNGTDAEISNTGYWGTVNASTWGAKSGGFSNNLSTTMLAYAFHSVDGYSKVGSFVGNGSETAGPFVYCGFRPAYVMIKQSSGTGSWVLLDTTRSAFNVINNASLWANDSSGEGGSASYFDMLSNGFKIRDTDSDKNDSGQTYIFLAFAEMPFKHTNAR